MLQSIRSTDFPVQHQLAFWYDHICPYIYAIETESAPADDFSFSWENRDCGAFGLTHVESATTIRRRSRASVARDGFDAVSLQRSDSGPLEVSISGKSFRLEQGDWIALSLDWPHEMRGDRSIGLRSIEVPKETLSPFLLGGRLRAPAHIPSRSPVGALLTATFDGVWRQVPELEDLLAERLLHGLSGLVAVACGATADRRDPSRQAFSDARLRQIQEHIHRNLANPALSAASTATALGISPRYLHKLLELTGESFAQHVLRKRLASCRASLQNPGERNRSTTDIALGWGFGSLPTFYRAFTRAYGCAPGDLRGSGARNEASQMR